MASSPPRCAASATARTGSERWLPQPSQILGRPNVGKSTLFNRLVGKRVRPLSRTGRASPATVTTATSNGAGVHFTAVDTGGFAEEARG